MPTTTQNHSNDDGAVQNNTLAPEISSLQSGAKLMKLEIAELKEKICRLEGVVIGMKMVVTGVLIFYGFISMMLFVVMLKN